MTADDLRPMLVEEIGYSIISRESAAGIMGVFLLALLLLGFGLRRSRRPEIVGWLSPAAAVATATLFVVLAIASRRAVAPTVATAAIADVVPGSNDVAFNGLFAVYQPESGLVPLSATASGQLDLDQDGLEGQLRRRLQTDSDAWHWEGFTLPAGVRTGPYKLTTPNRPVSAIARFGPNGLEGKLAAAGFRDLTDAVVTTSLRQPLAIALKSDGSFVAGMNEMLPAGQFLAGTVLSDRQQRRQAVYRQLLSGPLPRHMEGRDLLLTWAEVVDGPFAARDGARTINTALVIVPLQFERPQPGTRVAIPPAFVPYRRVLDVGSVQAATESIQPMQMQMRFQLPASVLPLRVERIALHLQMRAPARRVAIAGLANGQQVPLESVDNPTTPIRVEITEERFLRIDEQGGLHVVLTISNLAEGPVDTPWRIESLGLEVIGKTEQPR